MGTCTIIATGANDAPNYLACFVPLKKALKRADKLKAETFNTGGPLYSSVRVYSEAVPAMLTLIYVPD